ncbi:MAG: flagellin [Chitinispirillaceae bacterium]
MPRINYNAPAMTTVSRMNQINKHISSSTEKISSGMRINRAADDVYGHSTSEQLRAQIRGMSTASRNNQDGIALINVAEGALNEVTLKLQRMRELSVQASTATVTDKDRKNLELEMNNLKKGLDKITQDTEYNGQKLLNGDSPWGTAPGGVFHVGPNNENNTDYIHYIIPKIDTVELGIDGDNLRMDTQVHASDAISRLDESLNIVSGVRTDLGGISNRLEHNLKNQRVQTENVQAYESLIRDTDIADEMTKLTRDQVLKEYSTAMLSQANMNPQRILKLLE